MLNSDYSTEPPGASAVALAAISDKISDIRDEQKKLAEIPGMLSKMNMQLEQLTKDHQQTRQDLHETRNGFQSELEKIHKDVDELKTGKTRIDTLSDWFKWGGLALIAMIVSAWVNLSTKMDTTTTRSINNEQSIATLAKQSDQVQDKQGEIDKAQAELQREFYKRGMSDETNR